MLNFLSGTFLFVSSITKIFLSGSIHMKYMRVGVLMGGRSIEREVSLNSGRTICDHLDSSRYHIIPLFQTITGKLYILPWMFLHRGKTTDFEHRLEKEAQEVTWDSLKTLIDFMYIALHGRYGEDGTLQGFLEVLKIPYLGSKVFASALGMNKALQKDFLRAAGVDVPRGCVVKVHEIDTALTSRYDFCEITRSERSAEKPASYPLSSSGRQSPEGATTDVSRTQCGNDVSSGTLCFPLIVKPVQEGSSFGVSKVTSLEELNPALIKASTAQTGMRQDVIVEEYIQGMEFSCIIITDYHTGVLIALPPTEIEIEKASGIFDYEQKYMPGRATKHTPARCSSEQIILIQAVCKKVFQVLGFENFGRIDGFLTPDGRVVITDPNSFSGMSPSSYAFLQAAEVGMSHAGLINHLIETELHAYGMQAFATQPAHQGKGLSL